MSEGGTGNNEVCAGTVSVAIVEKLTKQYKTHRSALDFDYAFIDDMGTDVTPRNKEATTSREWSVSEGACFVCCCCCCCFVISDDLWLDSPLSTKTLVVPLVSGSWQDLCAT
jgi:hypothetical protein